MTLKNKASQLRQSEFVLMPQAFSGRNFSPQHQSYRWISQGFVHIGLLSLLGVVAPSAIAQTTLPQLVPAPTQEVDLTTQVGTVQNSAYVLGAGDAIQVDIFDVPEFSGANGRYTILVDGSLNLPWIGNVLVQGMTLDEASAAITERYAPFIREPLVTVSLITPRPLRIGVVGQVNRPGAYTVGPGTANPDGATGVPSLQTVTQAIQAAGGITQMANIRKIEIHRPQRQGNQTVINVDLWDFLKTGNLSQDISLRDGDTVVIPTATELNLAEAGEVATASFSPSTININVVGEVTSPGLISLPPNSSLNQAILAAGGFNNSRANRGQVDLIRLHPNGTATQRRIPVNLSSGLSEETNPSLRSNDVIIVRRSSLASSSDFLGTILNPLGGILGILRLFGGF